MTEHSYAVLHSDYRHWLSDRSLRQMDIVLWQQEIDQAFKELRQVESALRGHRRGLQEYASRLRAEAEALTSHERGLSEFGPGAWEPGGELTGMAEAHHESADKQARCRDAHERRKRRHHTVMAQMALLARALAEAV